MWTYNPRNKPGERNLPFILRPSQVDAVSHIADAIKYGNDLLIDKSRDEGATEIITKTFLLFWMLQEECALLVGSRKEEYVDHSTMIRSDFTIAGDHKCLFHKFLYGLATLPAWLRPRFEKTHMQCVNPDNGSVLIGESTNENFGAGDRRTAILLDEFGRVDHKLAQNIRESVADVSDCVLYNSTHFYGRGHPFARLRFSGKCQVIVLPWWKNPEKMVGLYKSPEIDEIKILDKEYYKPLLKHIEGDTFKLSTLEKELLTDADSKLFEQFKFVADGTDWWHSLWYDREVARRDPRDVAQNINMDPAGAGDNFFDHRVLQSLRTEFLRPPKYVGEIDYLLDPRGKIQSPKFVLNGGHKRFRWWGKLNDARPIQTHNYIVSCDISLGTGASNSVAKVYDVNTRECVGMYINSQLPPAEFCDQVIALCYWIGGHCGQPFLIWEANGPGGSFDTRRRKHGYGAVYIDTVTRTKNKKRTKKPGWYSTKQAKYDALLGLRTALAEGVRTNPIGSYLKIYDEDSIREYEDYIFYENGDIGLSGAVNDTAGARSAHGDTVIPDAMAILAMNEQPKAMLQDMMHILDGSMQHRRWMFDKQQKEEGRDSPWLR